MGSAKGIITLAIGVAILLYTVSAIVPDAIANFNDANTTGWDASVLALWNIIPIFGMLSIAIGAIVIGVQELSGLAVKLDYPIPKNPVLTERIQLKCNYKVV